MRKSISLLGSTGSIGRQTLEVCSALGIRVAAIAAAGSDTRLLEKQIREFKPDICAVNDTAAAMNLRENVRATGTRILGGGDAILEAAAYPSDITVNAIVGKAGLSPTLAAIDAGRDIALANKETLVCAGISVMKKARERGVSIIPVDSEHSAIFQCMRACDGNGVKTVILTASGGPFLGYTPRELENVTVSGALDHPNWKMGAKISVDSATMMNKGLEFIEAMRLFGLRADQIRVVIHKQSIVHSAVEFEDGSVIAQLGVPDMRIPIQYALTYPERRAALSDRLDLAKVATLTFENPDYNTFPCLSLAMQCANLGDNACMALNDANESAVASFLREEIKFAEIYTYVKSKIGHIL